MRHVFIGSAWPYANGSLHLGHVAGLLPADVLARYHRLFGDKVLWTSGSDCHGTPITERARKEGSTSRDVAERFHAEFVETFNQLGFSYSLYWATMEPEHHARVQVSFLELHSMGLIIEDDFSRAKCVACNGYRADREIEGACPHCKNEGARGDQCDFCGTELNPDEVVDPVCNVCQGSITFEISRELFFDLPQLAERLLDWVGKQDHWRENAKQWTSGWLRTGLKPRPISRKIDWGIPIPLDGWGDYCIYVWFEAVHGYWTASVQHAIDSGDPDAWKPFWDASDKNVRHYYVIGKDNIPFHTLMWPGILMAHDRALPYHIVSSEFLGLEGAPLSTSRNWAIWVPDFLERYSADALRYFLIANGPEKRDVDFTWKGFVERFNGEVVNNYGNLVNRVLKFAHKRYEGKVPTPGELDHTDRALLSRVDLAFKVLAIDIENTEFRSAISALMELVRAANKYLHEQEPWKVIKTDPDRAATVLWTAMKVISALSILTEPFMPFQAEKLRAMLHTDHYKWSTPELKADADFGPVEALFEKIDPAAIEEELERLKSASSD